MKMTLRTAAIATSTFVFASAFSLGWSEQGSLSLSISKADAVARVYVRGYTRSVYGLGGPTGLPWYAVRAYYNGGPWSIPGTGNVWTNYTGWADYAARNGIGCTPGTAIRGGDGIMYNCQ
jgi:hypothetical protein